MVLAHDSQSGYGMYLDAVEDPLNRAAMT